MAAFMCSRFLSRTSALAECTLLSQSSCFPRISVSFDQKRWRRRKPTGPPPSTQKLNPKIFKQELTSENRHFLKEVVHDEYLRKLEDSPLKKAPLARNEFDMSTRRTGLIGIKLGSFPQWTKNGKKFSTTLVQVLDNHVIKYIPPEEFVKYETFRPKWRKRHDRFGSLIVGALSCEPFRFTQEYVRVHEEAGVPPKRKLMRFPVTEDAVIQPGTPLSVSHFRVGDYVDVSAKTIGHGFQGVIKRWGFKGGPATHGPTKFKRRGGSLSGGSAKAGVWRGKKMPGPMGNRWVLQRGLRIWRINHKYNVLYLHGSGLPGPTHCYIKICDSMLAKYVQHRVMGDKPDPPMPTWYPEDQDGPIPEEEFHPDMFRMDTPSVVFAETETTPKVAGKTKPSKNK